ncbi:NADH-cytochrome b5 reductase-like [Phlebotomus argentipes]|uniref:NADH-cytochrome b5 reductase-like n=1 Tax=Phlebotomus argentipes TaxID=94469 RepID=UPI002893381E|nr:NADH-cytochrome b5 reductase-like [Phlebotomus argentipes]
MDDEEEECCGSGCNNCVLDRKPRNFRKSIENSVNVFNEKYVRFSIETIKQVATSVYSISFRCKSEELTGRCVLGIPPGSYLQLRCHTKAIRKDQNPIFKDFTFYDKQDDFLSQIEVQDRHDKDTSRDYLSRPYTPINVDTRNLTFDILFKPERFGKMTQLVTKLYEGDEVEFKGPYGELVYQPNTFSHLYFFSHGVAVAPLYSLISSIVNDESDETFLHLVACYRNMNEALLRDEVQTLQQFWNFNASIFLPHETTDIEGRVKFCESIYKKRLQREDISEIVKFRDRTSYFLICGTEKFTRAVKDSLRSLAVDEDRIFVFK